MRKLTDEAQRSDAASVRNLVGAGGERSRRQAWGGELNVAAVHMAVVPSSVPSALRAGSERVSVRTQTSISSISPLPLEPPVGAWRGRPSPRSGETVRSNSVLHPGVEPGLVAVVVRLLGADGWSPADLVAIVGSGWRDDASQSDALAALLRRAVPPDDLVALGDVWETAAASLARRSGPLTLRGADRLVGEWLALAAERADSWRRPRSQRRKRGRRSECPVGDLSRAAR